MKRITSVLICFIAGMGCICSCDGGGSPEIGDYPRTTLVEEGTYDGRIVSVPNPPDGSGDPVLPGTVLALRSDSNEYLLVFDGHWVPDESVSVGGILFSVGERVRIAGTLRTTQVSDSEQYTELAVETIETPEIGDYPRTTLVEEGTYDGRIVAVPNPPDGSGDPVLPGTVLALRSDSNEYLLVFDGHWVPDESVSVGGILFSVGERVRITGTLRTTQVSDSEQYTELAVETIVKRD